MAKSNRLNMILLCEVQLKSRVDSAIVGKRGVSKKNNLRFDDSQTWQDKDECLVQLFVFFFLCFCLVHFEASGHTILIEMIRG